MAGRKLDLDRQQTSLRMHSDAIIRTLAVGGNTPDGWPHCGVLAAAPAASASSLSRHVHELEVFLKMPKERLRLECGIQCTEPVLPLA